jgi:hypothetical protein
LLAGGMAMLLNGDSLLRGPNKTGIVG